MLKKEVAFTRSLDAQRPLKKTLYGSGLFVSDDKAAELKAAELKAAKEVTVFRLSERERQIINNLE
jgi:hypothetical protein